MMSGVDVTAVINAHREGLIARAALMSVSMAKTNAEMRGFKVEVVVVLDQADALTTEIIKTWQDVEACSVIEVGNGDLGLSRNDGVAASRGEWIAFLDADDLWGQTWLSAGLEAAANERRSIVWHPEVNVFFGASRSIFRHIDMETAEFDALSLCASNYWTALCMARREFLVSVPYPRTDLASQIGYEDWHWNMAAIGRGAIHKIVVGTGHAIRSRPGSLVKKTVWNLGIPKPDRNFRKYLFMNPKYVSAREEGRRSQEGLAHKGASRDADSTTPSASRAQGDARSAQKE